MNDSKTKKLLRSYLDQDLILLLQSTSKYCNNDNNNKKKKNAATYDLIPRQ